LTGAEVVGRKNGNYAGILIAAGRDYAGRNSRRWLFGAPQIMGL
jgi:hypothetical protein